MSERIRSSTLVLGRIELTFLKLRFLSLPFNSTHPVRDVLKHAQTSDAFDPKEVGGVTLRLGKYRSKEIADCHLIFTGILHVKYRPLNDPLEREGLLGLNEARIRNSLELRFKVFFEVCTEPRYVSVTLANDGCPTVVLDERKEQVFKTNEFMLSVCRFITCAN